MRPAYRKIASNKAIFIDLFDYDVSGLDLGPWPRPYGESLEDSGADVAKGDMGRWTCCPTPASRALAEPHSTLPPD
jgi:hypothetical protein